MSLTAPEPLEGSGSAPLPNNVRQLRPARRRWAEWPFVAVWAVILVSMGITADDHFRRGAVLFSFAVGLAFFLRLLLPDRDAGMLAVRSKRVDLVVLGVLALAVSVLSLIVPPPS